MKLYRENVRLDVRKFFFSERIVDRWNQLPQEVVNATSLTTFKHKLDSWMQRLGNLLPSRSWMGVRVRQDQRSPPPNSS